MNLRVVIVYNLKFLYRRISDILPIFKRLMRKRISNILQKIKEIIDDFFPLSIM